MEIFLLLYIKSKKGGKIMFSFIKKVTSTISLVRKNLPMLIKEANDLKGVTKEVIEQIIIIWK